MEAGRVPGREADIAPAPADPTGGRLAGWTPADPGPLGLAGFATTTFALSMINANLVSAGALPAVAVLASPTEASLSSSPAFGSSGPETRSARWRSRPTGRSGSRSTSWSSSGYREFRRPRCQARSGSTSGPGGSSPLTCSWRHCGRPAPSRSSSCCWRSPSSSLDRQLGPGRRHRRDQRHGQARRIHRACHRDRGVVRLVRRGHQLDLWSGGGAGLPAQALTHSRIQRRHVSSNRAPATTSPAPDVQSSHAPCRMGVRLGYPSQRWA